MTPLNQRFLARMAVLVWLLAMLLVLSAARQPDVHEVADLLEQRSEMLEVAR